MTTTDSILIKALGKQKLSTPPIWYMRQAGRYMPEYRAVRKKFKNFLDMCKNPDVCCELALQPLNAFNLDAAILFSDILTIPDALGLEVTFIEKIGPVFNNPIRSSYDVNQIKMFDPESLSYVYEAVQNIKRSIPADMPLIGFCGSPWTLVAYSIEGHSSSNFKKTKTFIENEKDSTHDLLTRFTDACFLYLREQVKAGADVIQIFDSWANLLSRNDLIEFSMKYITALINALKNDPITTNIPIILFSRDPKIDTKELINSNADCISLYWKMKDFNTEDARGKVALQGDLNPKILLENKDIISLEANKVLEKYKDYPGYIFNLGHGITPDIDPDKIRFLTDIIRNN
tara:strand:+ start:2377 stop:3414 length:1038 start_codon:yes stop_codon:yes gene_type:complete